LGKIIAGMTMSLDGFVSDAEGNVDRLYTDFAELQTSPSMEATIAETGAVIMGRKMFELGDPDSWDDYEFQAPIFVVTRHPPLTPPQQNDRLTFTFVTDGVASVAAQAQAAAGGKDVQVVGGVRVIQQLLREGLVDELHIDIMPVLLSNGQRFFPRGEPHDVDLELLRVETLGQRIGLRFAVNR
jgi:dihydrofolate reductase